VLVVFDNLLSKSKSKFLLKRKSFSDFDPENAKKIGACDPEK
jgi:hypothetical protein